MVHDFWAAAQSGLEQVNGYGIYLSDAAYLARSEAQLAGEDSGQIGSFNLSYRNFVKKKPVVT